MKSRTLISFCQRPVRNPCQGDVAVVGFVCSDTVVVIKYSFGGSDRVTPRSDARSNVQFQQRRRVPGDDELFVGGNGPRRHAAAWPRDSGGPRLVRRRIELDAEPGGRVADSPADFGRVLADASG